MPNEQDRPFGEYAPEAQTAGCPPGTERSVADEMERLSEKYGIAKPRRIIVRGTVAKDKSPNDTRE